MKQSTHGLKDTQFFYAVISAKTSELKCRNAKCWQKKVKTVEAQNLVQHWIEKLQARSTVCKNHYILMTG